MTDTTSTIEPGRYCGMTMNEYHGNTPGLSRGDLMEFKRSSAHYMHRRAHRNDTTPAKSFGQALHCKVLEPELFAATYVRAPKVDRRTKDGKEAWAAFEEANRGKIPLDHVDTERLEAMYLAITKHPIAGPLVTGGEREVSYFWRDPETKLLLKARPDLITPDRIVVDLKTTADASEFSFTRAVVRYGYHIQATMVWEAMRAIDGQPPKAYIALAIESDEPYALATYVFDDFVIKQSRPKLRDLLLGFMDWESTPAGERWIGYPLELTPIRLPDWA